MAKTRSNGHHRVAASAPHHDVLLGYLCGNEVTQSFHRSFFDLVGHDLSGAARLQTWAQVRSGVMGLPESRNKLCQQLLDSDAQWLLMVDSDMGFAPNTLDRLLEAADPQTRPVVGGLCFAMREATPDGMGGMSTFPSPTILQWQRHSDNVWRFTGQDHYPVNALVKVGATGAACLLIHRSALVQIGGDWFTRLPTEDGEMQGEDISFCWRLQAEGIPLWIHTGIRTTHFKHLWLAEADFWASRVAPPATERVDVIVPALHRPQNVTTVMRSLRASTGLATAWWVCEPDDQEEIAAVQAEGGEVLSSVKAHSFAEKVNHAYRETSAPWLLLVGDDVRFRPGWLDAALDVARRYQADVVATNDLLNKRVIDGETATHPLIRRSYITEVGASWDGPGVVAHEGYHHWFVDDEISSAARLRGVFQAALGSHVEHLHPMGGSVEMDEVYRLGASRKVEDGALFRRRLAVAMRAAEPRARQRHLAAV
ncbi:MAG: glycosyltransferase family 2 protein [Candidatus Dormibacteria bacterium]